MKKIILQFLAAALGAAAGGIMFALTWSAIDRFCYDAFGIVIQCDGCQTASLSLLYGFIPAASAVCAAFCGWILYRVNGWFQLLGAFLCSIAVGGTLSLLAVQVASGLAAAILVAILVSASATAGALFGGRQRRMAEMAQKEAYDN